MEKRKQWRLNETGWCHEADVYENQAFIVQAVNSHEKLTEALKMAIRALEDNGIYELADGEFETLTNAIAQAEGEK